MFKFIASLITTLFTHKVHAFAWVDEAQAAEYYIIENPHAHEVPW